MVLFSILRPYPMCHIPLESPCKGDQDTHFKPLSNGMAAEELSIRFCYILPCDRENYCSREDCWQDNLSNVTPTRLPPQVCQQSFSGAFALSKSPLVASARPELTRNACGSNVPKTNKTQRIFSIDSFAKVTRK